MSTSPAVLAARRARFLGSMEAGSVAIFPTGPEVRRSNDTEYPFRPDSDFFYLTGFDEPEGFAVLSQQSGAFVLFVRPKDKEREVWTGRRVGPEGARARLGADQALACNELDSKMPELLRDATAVYHFLGRYPEMDQRLTGWIGTLKMKPREGLAPRRVLDPGPILHEMRLFKSDDDLATLRKAVSISAEAHREAMAATKPGMKEYEIQAVVEYVFRRRGAWAPGYNSIVGAGANATVLHYVTNRDTLKDGELLLLDAGAEVDLFTGDITRTWPIGGKWSKPQRALYESVLEAQRRTIAAVKPGATILGLHQLATRALTEGMVANGLLEGSVDGLIESDAYKRFYMHRTSHWLGMDVHDVGDYVLAGPGAASTDAARQRTLEPGMVITVEPGLYVDPEESVGKADPSLRGVGIRIEDDVLVTRDGNEVLSRECPKDPADVEREMARVSVFA